jgi:YfiH family protein
LSLASFRTTTLQGIELLQSVSLAGVPHGFTLRTSGFGSRENGAADRERLVRAIGFSRLEGMHQVHGNAVQVLDGGAPPRCDGLMTDEAGVGVAVASADCVPLLFWAPKANAVAAVHAGWRGTLAGIATRAVERLGEVYGAASSEIRVAIGPAIRVCCYEVGDEVIASFAESGGDIERIPRPRRRRHLDLVEENRAQLLSSGVAVEHVYDSGLCTFCENSSFYSFRREGVVVGRVFGVIGVPLSLPRSRSLHPPAANRR